jgi:hypothetical protein
MNEGLIPSINLLSKIGLGPGVNKRTNAEFQSFGFYCADGMISVMNMKLYDTAFGKS